MDTGIFAGPAFSVDRSIIRALNRSRYVPVVAISADMEGRLRLPEDVAVTRWNFSPESGRHRLLTDRKHGVLGLIRFVREREITILHCTQETVCSFLGIAVARATGARVVIHHHTAPSRGGSPLLRRVAIDLADANIAISNFIADDVLSHSLRKRPVDCVTNAVNVDEFRPGIDGRAVRAEYGVRDDEVLLLQLGRFEQYKRQLDFVKAFALARQQVPQLRGLLIGWSDPNATHSYRNDVERACREAGLGNAVILADARPDAPNVHAAADGFVMPAVDEPFGLVVIEAMSSGRPVLAVRSGALPEIVVEGETGLLTPPCDPQALAHSMIALASDSALRRRLGENGRARVLREYGEARLGPQLSAIYERVAATASPVSRGVSSREATGSGAP